MRSKTEGTNITTPNKGNPPWQQAWKQLREEQKKGLGCSGCKREDVEIYNANTWLKVGFRSSKVFTTML